MVADVRQENVSYHAIVQCEMNKSLQNFDKK